MTSDHVHELLPFSRSVMSKFGVCSPSKSRFRTQPAPASKIFKQSTQFLSSDKKTRVCYCIILIFLLHYTLPFLLQNFLLCWACTYWKAVYRAVGRSLSLPIVPRHFGTFQFVKATWTRESKCIERTEPEYDALSMFMLSGNFSLFCLTPHDCQKKSCCLFFWQKFNYCISPFRSFLKTPVFS